MDCGFPVLASRERIGKARRVRPGAGLKGLETIVIPVCLSPLPGRLIWLGRAGRSLRLVASVIACAMAMSPLSAVACQRADFEAVVDDAAAALRELNLKNRPAFQDKLRALKDKRSWTHDQFIKEAAPFVKDEQIEVFDSTSNDMLLEISSMGQVGATAATPDCVLLAKLRGHMATLVETQSSKWSYMFGKLDAELAR